ncbi:CoA-binding protein [Aliikangiella maris]|uniref:CoA-binding protein n=2 Tax=Aliikangiella maris TaxID=3162458 RepID=A0ABV2BTJ5_9GAMM
MQDTNNSSKTTAILGASDDPSRYAYKACKQLIAHGHPVILIARRPITVDGISSLAQLSDITGKVDTVTLYINPNLVNEQINAIIQLAPKRVIFNPGTESTLAIEKLSAAGIQVVTHCTLIMLQQAEY